MAGLNRPALDKCVISYWLNLYKTLNCFLAGNSDLLESCYYHVAIGRNPAEAPERYCAKPRESLNPCVNALDRTRAALPHCFKSLHAAKLS